MEDTSQVQNGQSLIIIGKLFTKPRYFNQIKQDKILKCRQAHLRIQICYKDHNQHPHILKDIIHIRFMNLTLLQLSNNNIANIEPLQFLQAQQLKNLHLSFNDFVEGKSLRKCLWPQLEKLSLMSTRIRKFSFLQQCHFPKLNNLLLEDSRNPRDSRLNSLTFTSKTFFAPNCIFSYCDKEKLLLQLKSNSLYGSKK